MGSDNRVYGLLGLSDIADKLKIEYTASAPQASKAAMITLLNHQKDLNPLSGCQWRGDVADLPSWVINLNEDFEAMVLRPKERGEELYHVSGEGNAYFKFFEPGGLLRAHGFLFDTVHTVGGTAALDDSGRLRQCFEEWLLLAQNTVALRPSELADNELIHEFYRTIVADQDDYGDRASTVFCKPSLEAETLTTLPTKLAKVFDEEATGFVSRISEVCSERLMIGTSKGYIGVTGKACMPKDIVCVLLGAGVPFILRSRGAEYVLIGEACRYCHILGES